MASSKSAEQCIQTGADRFSSARKYVEQFSNGITIICTCLSLFGICLLSDVAMYLNPVPNTRAPPIEHSIHQVVREASLLYSLPDNPFVRRPHGN
jgi:glutamate dehydrogenase